MRTASFVVSCMMICFTISVMLVMAASSLVFLSLMWVQRYVKKSENSFLIDVLCYNCFYFIENSYLCSDLGVFSNKCTICINPHAMKCHGVREQ